MDYEDLVNFFSGLADGQITIEELSFGYRKELYQKLQEVATSVYASLSDAETAEFEKELTGDAHPFGRMPNETIEG